MRPASNLVLVLIFGALASSCVSDRAHRYYLDEELPPREPESVEILYEEPGRPYEVIADLQARGASPDYMQQEAAKIGADAVIVNMLGGTRAYRDEWAGESSSQTYSRITGTAIIFQ